MSDDAGAVPGDAAEFLTVAATAMVPPRAARPGAVNALTTRSGRTTVIVLAATWPLSAKLSLPLVSGMALPASATAARKKVPAAKFAGRSTASVEARLAPAPRPARSLNPTPMPSPGAGFGAAARNRFTRKGPTAAVPALRAVNETVIGRPVAAAAGPATAEICRSAKSPISMGTARALLDVSLSGTVPSALVCAMMNFAPVVTEAGIASFGAALKMAPGASAATGMAGVSSTSPPLSTESSER